MERHTPENFDAPAERGRENASAGSAGESVSSAPQADGATASTMPTGAADRASDAATMTDDPAANSGSTVDQAREKIDRGRDIVQDRLGQWREKATTLQATLADRLDTGAEKLRQRAQRTAATGAPDGTLAVAADGPATVASTRGDERLTDATNQLANGMSNTADWLRNGDMKADIERQVKEHPGRTLLIALGVGYLAGKAFKR